VIGIVQWALIIGGIVLGAIGGIFLKIGAQELSHDQHLQDIVWSAITNYKIALGFCMYLWPSFIWIYLLKKMDLSLLQPICALVYVITPILAFLFLKEQVSLQRGLGILIIMIGVYVVSKG
jgi:drug/metabolite transporter (DMT)-like permease